LSDYYYAYNTGGTINCESNSCNNWILNSLENNIWTMSRYGQYSNGNYPSWGIRQKGNVTIWGLNQNLEVLPVFYLNSDEQYISGEGTLDNPIMLNYNEYYTVKIKSNVGGPNDEYYEKAHVVIGDQIIKASQMGQDIDVTTVVVPSGTSMTCYANSGNAAFSPNISLNGEVVVSDADLDGIIEHDYIIRGDITVTLTARYVSPVATIAGITIVEDSQPSYNITLVPGDDTSGSGLGGVSLEQYTAKPGETVKIHISGSSSIYKGGIISYVLNGETVSYTYGDGIAVCQSQSKTESFIMPATDVTITYNGFQWSPGLC